MTLDTLLLYTVASFALGRHAGPDHAAGTVQRHRGRHAARGWGIAGASLGSSVLIATVALGLGSLLAASPVLFDAIRVAGIAYLVWLGVKLWRSQAPDLRITLAAAPTDTTTQGRVALFKSLAVALSNPKTLLFFAAFLPQFVDTAHAQGPQYLVLGALFVGLDTCVMLAYAAAGTQAVRWLSRRSLQRLNRGCAAGMWALAATLAFWRRPGA